MATASSNGSRVGNRHRAEDLLASPSEQEAVQLEPRPCEETLHWVPTASPLISRPYFVRLWRRHVAPNVRSDACRDHWANERTALGYIRTAQAFAMTGVVIAQVMRLNGNEDSKPGVGFFEISVPLAVAFHGTAVVISIVGAIRFYHWQHEMACGYAITSGWELMLVVVLSLALLIALLVIVFVITIKDS